MGKGERKQNKGVLLRGERPRYFSGVNKKIQLWLNSDRPYGKGVALYVAYGSNLIIKHKLLQGDTPGNRAILELELKRLVSNDDAPIPKPDTQPAVVETTPILAAVPNPAVHKPTNHIPTSNPALAAAVRTEAHKTYREMMNKRAVLLTLCRSEPWEDENSTDRIALRGGIALDILDFNKKAVTPAYDKLEYVEQHGHLPPVLVPSNEDDEDDYSLLPDAKVKPTIDNIRKNLSKLRKREPTEERLALIKRHEKNLDKLLIRWHSLK